MKHDDIDCEWFMYGTWPSPDMWDKMVVKHIGIAVDGVDKGVVVNQLDL